MSKPAIDVSAVKGFLDAREARALYAAARSLAPAGPMLEVGSYCGKSAHYLGTACAERGELLFCVDHHRGSEENQPGWDYHDAELWDVEASALDTLPSFRRNIRKAGLEDTVVAVVGRSARIAEVWATKLALLFIDGGHTMQAALDDWRGWTPHLMVGGILAIHDVFPDPQDGGRPPFEIYRRALASDLFEEIEAVKSLRILRRIGGPPRERSGVGHSGAAR